MIKNNGFYFTTKEAASILNFSPDHMRRLILQNKIKAEKVGNNWLIKKSDLDKFKRTRLPKKGIISHGINE